MSVIAFDGKRLSADRQATYNGTKLTIDKIFQPEPHIILGFVGEHAQGTKMIEWFMSGADPTTFPEPKSDEGAASLIVLTKHKEGETHPAGDPVCLFYASSSVALQVIEPVMAWGSGGQFAHGAMLAGATASKAVEIASTVAEGCGNGVTTYQLKGKPNARH